MDMQLFLVVPPLIMVYERNCDLAWKIVKGLFYSSAISRVLVSIFAEMSVCKGAGAAHQYMYTKPFVFHTIVLNDDEKKNVVFIIARFYNVFECI